ncbi:hypothetical protein K491DRAFT_673684 [Lophiostoma macrostomum CBS 122681]|uniref:Uncharacterized protein n=1 Tax=Lophiostoma macrostomum CBS 122681 TaxID=1314788 RepID=A0A6A6TT15_9PLEO|nr:hypothetical protein K491DRAFT_673684 [Lophiostoma macrostomum CBS 122681]
MADTFFAQLSNNRMQASVNKGCFRFLDLPGELRNRVYEFTLSTKDGIVYNSGVMKATNSGTIKKYLVEKCQPEFNQLQYVNHQLREETQFLELGYNNLIFRGNGSMLNAAKSLLQFRKRVSLHKLEQIRSLHLNPDQVPLTWLHAASIARSLECLKEAMPGFPNAMVHYTLYTRGVNPVGYSDLGINDFIESARTIAAVLYEKHLGEFNQLRFEAKARKDREDYPIQELMEALPNLRFWPARENVDEFKSFVRWDNLTCRDTFAFAEEYHTEERLKFWAGVYEDWHEHGIPVSDEWDRREIYN